MSENTSIIVAAQDKDGNKALRAETSGILMHPEVVERWDALVPGAAKEILNMALFEQRHRVRSNYLGIASGVLIVLCVLGLAAYMVYNGQTPEALATVLVPLGGILATAFGVAWVAKKK